MDGRIRGGAQILVGLDTSIDVPNASGLEFERVDIGDAPGAIHDPVGFDVMLGAAMLERQAKAAAARDDLLDHRSGFYLDSDPLAFGADPSNRIGIHPGQQSRQDLENGDLRARARIGMTKFERDDAATYENHLAR